MKTVIKNAIKQYFAPVTWLKGKLKYVNQWNVIFYALVLSQLFIGYTNDELLHSLWGVGLIWTLYLIGYNSLDRELKIMLDKARTEMAKNEAS